MRWALVKIMPLAVLSFTVAVLGQTRQPCSILRTMEGFRVELISGEIIRLIGVQPFPNLQSNLSQISAFFDSLVIGKSAALEFDDNLPETFGYLWQDSVSINTELLRQGWARIWDDTTRFNYKKVFLAAENAARQAKLGYWKFAIANEAAPNVLDDTVYVTKYGKKYHRVHCRLLSQNKTALPLSQARADYSPCRLCIVSTSSAKRPLSLHENDKTVAAQCLATTKNGDRCKREAEAGSKYCWQHRRK
jgi:hypothetical protein